MIQNDSLQTDLPVEMKELREALLRDYPYGLTLNPPRLTAEDILSLMDKGSLGRDGFVRAVVGNDWLSDTGLKAELHIPATDGYDGVWPDLTQDDIILDFKTAQGVAVAVSPALALEYMTIENMPVKDLVPALLAGTRPETADITEWALLTDISRRGVHAVDDRHGWQMGPQVTALVDQAYGLWADNARKRDLCLKALATEQLQRSRMLPCTPVTLECRYRYSGGSTEELTDKMTQRIDWFNNMWAVPELLVSPKVQHAVAGARQSDFYIESSTVSARDGVPVKTGQTEQVMTVSVWAESPKYLAGIRQSLAEDDDALVDIKVLPYRDIRSEGACRFVLKDNEGQKTLDGIVDPYLGCHKEKDLHLYKWDNLGVHPEYKKGTPLALEGVLNIELPNKAEVVDFSELDSKLEDYLAHRKETRPLSYRVTPGGVWLHQKEVNGYAFITPQRQVLTAGEPLGHKAMARVRQMAEEENVALPMAVEPTQGDGRWSGQRWLFTPTGNEPWRVLMQPDTGQAVRLQQVIDLKGRRCYGIDGMQAGVRGWMDISDRLEDVVVYNGADKERMFVRCKIDGVQMGCKPLTQAESKELIEDLKTSPIPEMKYMQLAVRHFREELKEGMQQITQQQGRGR